jgi:uncharacterized protein DUF3999
MTRILLSLLAGGAMLRADFNPAHWQARRPITLDRPAAVASFVVDFAMYQGSRARLNDILVLRDASETPYLIRTLSGSREERELKPALLNKGVAGNGLEATLDLGGHPTHNRLRVATHQKNFKQRVRIETSDDAKTWAVARDDGYIFDFSQGDRDVSVLTVDYPSSTRRFVKLTIFGWTNPDFLDSAWLTYYTSTSGVTDPLATITGSTTEEAKTQSTLVVADIGFDGLPHDRVQLAIDPGLFYRTVEVETSSDAKSWVYTGQGVISRTSEREETTLFIPEQWDRYVRLRILNQDNPPLHVQRVVLSAYRRVIEFPASVAGQYSVYYGNPDAKAPVYDFAHTVPEEAAPETAKLGTEAANPAYQKPQPPPTPWSDRHPSVLYGVLIAAILVMGFFAVNFLLKLRR